MRGREWGVLWSELLLVGNEYTIGDGFLLPVLLRQRLQKARGGRARSWWQGRVAWQCGARSWGARGTKVSQYKSGSMEVVGCQSTRGRSLNRWLGAHTGGAGGGEGSGLEHGDLGPRGECQNLGMGHP